MGKIALVSARASLATDHDMSLLLDACASERLDAEICFWDDPDLDWSSFDAAVLRSPWDYSERLPEFLRWCETVSHKTKLQNPVAAVRWSLDKHYLQDLANLGVPVVPSFFIRPNVNPELEIRRFLSDNSQLDDFVVKPTIGCYSKGVRRFSREQVNLALDHIASLHVAGTDAIAQPYLPVIDREGETNLIYFNGVYSHAIRKGALLDQDGSVNVPTNDFRAPREASADERALAETAIKRASMKFGLSQPLLYARIDLIRGDGGIPLLLELEIAEPSLSLQFTKNGASRFAEAISQLALVKEGT
jgi:O-ureido-D-serine cyclo-ligase